MRQMASLPSLMLFPMKVTALYLMKMISHFHTFMGKVLTTLILLLTIHGSQSTYEQIEFWSYFRTERFCILAHGSFFLQPHAWQTIRDVFQKKKNFTKLLSLLMLLLVQELEAGVSNQPQNLAEAGFKPFCLITCGAASTYVGPDSYRFFFSPARLNAGTYATRTALRLCICDGMDASITTQ